MGPRSEEEDESPLARFKWEAARQLGLLDKVRREGWGGLSSAESGRIGGLMNRLRAAARDGGGPRETRDR